MEKRITTPLTDDIVKDLKVGDRVMLSGTIYTGRDAAHKRLIDMLDQGKPLPVDLKGETIYYVGPCPAKPGYVIGSAGPTTSGRMDAYTPQLLELGMKGMIGKGLRKPLVVESIIKTNAVYFAAIGGAGALLAKAIKEAEVVAFEDLGAEAIYKLTVEDFPVTVVIDSAGNNLYEMGKKEYQIV
ncbi:MAG: Fe-S-containing hydro-lyase [Bacillota bacterium]|nr:Fe-S-containing hydro-lyase [Bacillota bacterium]